MNKQDKELLYKALCGYLPYGVMVEVESLFAPAKVVSVSYKVGKTYVTTELGVVDDKMVYETHFAESTKPYLRPMSSMTEEEKIELTEILDSESVDEVGVYFSEGGTLEDYKSQISWKLCVTIITWLNEHHFDYRGLIENGLALEAPADMYNN